MNLTELREIVTAGQTERREKWQKRVQEQAPHWFNADGSGKIGPFNPPWREPIWLASTLYASGNPELIGLANRSIARYGRCDTNDDHRTGVVPWKTTSLDFCIFNSTNSCYLLNRFDALLTPEARQVLTYHAGLAFQTSGGAAQPDYNFHGCNDNMPLMATRALILGGEKLGNRAAAEQGYWKIRQLARHFSRCAWLSEYNSITYSPVSLLAAHQIYHHTVNPEIRELTGKIIERIWAELLLHYHPGTLHHAGPQCRAYAADYAGHTHTLSVLFELVFGPELTGRNAMQTYFEPDGIEILHFSGCALQSIAEMSEVIDCEYIVPDSVLPLIADRRYPCETVGRTEMIGAWDGAAAESWTRNYMDEKFSLGTVTHPLGGGPQTTSLYATYRLRSPMRDWRDAATVFCRFRTDSERPATFRTTSVDGKTTAEAFVPNQAHTYAVNHRNTALVATVTPSEKPLETDNLTLYVMFPVHYGDVKQWILGDVAGGVESPEVVPFSVAAGEVFVHVQPLLPTGFPRKAAVRFAKCGNYRQLELVNYEGPRRVFTPEELALCCNGFLFTIDDASRYRGLEEFHRKYSDLKILDYHFGRRFLRVDRGDEHFELVMSTRRVGIGMESYNGRCWPRPLIASTALDVSKLPFVEGPVAYDPIAFPWGDTLDVFSFKTSWLIGSRGNETKGNYSNRKERILEK